MPAVTASGDSRITAGLLLVSRTITPPCCDPPNCPEKKPYCSPEPTVAGSENSVIAGAETVTGCVAASVAVNPGAVARTLVLPPPIGSNAIPPVGTVAGELDCPGPIVTVRDCPDPACVTSCATAPLLLVTVTTTLLPPIRTACAGDTNVLGDVPAATPICAVNVSVGSRLVIDAGRPVR